MADEPDFTTLKDQYAARVTADLEANQQDQARIRDELDTLKGRLESLEHDHGLLQTMQHTLGGTAATAAQASKATATRKRTAKTQPPATTSAPAAATAPATTPTVAAVPKPRKPRAEKPETKEAGATKVTKAAQSPKKAAAPARKATRKSADGSGPTLRELVLGLFADHREPRTVADILTELTTAHPDRGTSPQVVRNTLEALVAKGELERERRQGSVFYTAHRDPAPAAKSDAPTAEAVAAPATAPAAAPADATV
ncbi:hypothetical protein A8W25_24470 [Streptomyces sp. ERV7]|uniref:hypothetical protein n=1 Tax=Streptomyces sp. ERV7 TaxID=1322334 RepID=UPI0007F4455A|nr:hypothetical protein [Streptomyces sp. ERV7]OAR22741.1 hypothetical protein A8W25_24470 [Streptomyces sp. ERV7]